MAQIETTGTNLPEIYAYETPGISYHNGWLKIGETKGEFEQRIEQQLYKKYGLSEDEIKFIEEKVKEMND